LPSFIDNPLIFLSFQNGGMSFHGGFIGVLLATILFNRKTGKTFFQTTDFIAPLVPLGLFFGRIGNYINGELWGKVTSSNWGVYSPNYLGEWAYRYPTQLFEAFLEGLVLFAILWLFTNKSRPLMAPSSLFLILYGLFRFIIEFIRMPDIQLGYLAFGWLTMGQLLSLPMVIIGIFLFYKAQLTGNKL
jgi:phosphatidylglycerol:prolipoprotein diacylglycerol transferase